MTPTKIKRHEHWRMQYHEHRYMRGLSSQELDHRFADVLSNQTILTEERKIGIGGIEWMEKGTHILEEYSIRGRGLPPVSTIERRLRVPKTDVNLALIHQIRADYPKGIPSDFAIFKYGKKEHLIPLFEEGALRLSPASTYDDPSLNPAIEDQELAIEKIDGDSRTLYRSTSDYYCFCSAYLHSDRLIEDFDSNCIVVVTDPKTFFQRLTEALNEPSYDHSFNAVKYIDPLLLEKHHPTSLVFVKHMRFSYQFEHRFVAFPGTAIDKLPIRELKLEGIQDIAKIYGV